MKTNVSLLSLVSSSLVAAASLLTSCEPGACANDGDCAHGSVCVVDDGAAGAPAHCVMVSVADTGDAQLVDVELVEEGITLVDVAFDTAPAPEARAGTIVMRPLSVVVTRNPESEAKPRSTP